MKGRTGGMICLAFIISCLLGGGVVRAQTDAEINAGIQLNFSTPGARSMGLGGAFLGLADDATAAFTNPAGLTILRRPEISVEGRDFSFTSEFTNAGHAFGQPSGTGVDTVAGLQTGESEDDVSNLSFLSFVYPGERWAVAFYRHELANFEASFSTEGAFFDSLGGAGEGVTNRLFPISTDMNLEIVNFGFSAAYRLSDRFSLGLGVSYYDFEMDSLTQRFFVRPFTDEMEAVTPGGFFGPPDVSQGNEINFQEQIGDDDDTTFNLGFLWRLSSKWSLGGVYRQGPEFAVDATNRLGSLGAEMFDAERGTVIFQKVARFNVPDVYGLGFAFQPSDTVRITFDYDRVEYSALTEDLVTLFAGDELTDTQQEALDRLEIDDGDELHLGFEYTFINLKNPFALRFGSWLDPEHKIVFEGEPGTDFDTRIRAVQFRGGDDELHYSVGFGLVFGQHFQLDAAFDFSDLIDTGSLSAVYRF